MSEAATERPPKRQRVDSGSDTTSAAAAASSSLNLFTELRNLRQFGVLTDITLRSGDSEVRAHRCVLAASSDYFRACLTSSMKESESNCVIDLPLMDGDSLYRITDFIYGEDIEIHADNIVSILDSADKLSLDLLKSKCCTYLQMSLTPETCFNVYYLADQYNCLELCRTIFSYICRNFEGASKSEEFLKLPFEEVYKYLSSDSLSVKNESVTFHTAIHWIMYSKESRYQYLEEIFQTVRLRFMTVQDIAQSIHPYLNSNPQLFESPQGHACLLKIMDAYRWHALPLTDPEKLQSLDGSVDLPRNYSRKQAVRDRLFVVGGDDGYDDHSPFNGVMILDEILKEWINLPAFTQPRSVPGAVAFDHRLCVIGGYDGARASSAVDVFDIATNTWITGPPLKQRRCSCVCVVYQDCIYCIGGVCGPQALNSVEKISIVELIGRHPETSISGGWTECSSLQENRSACGAAVLKQENSEDMMILVCGGITTGGDTVGTTEKYSELTQSWAPVAPMLSPRRSFGMCVSRGKAYAFGGNDGARDLNTVEEYDPSTNTWRQLSPMVFRRMFCSASILGDKILVVGGVNSGTTLDCCECYDPMTDEWSIVDPPLPSPMCGCGVVSAEDISYSFILKLEYVSEGNQNSNEEKVAELPG